MSNIIDKRIEQANRSSTSDFLGIGKNKKAQRAATLADARAASKDFVLLAHRQGQQSIINSAPGNVPENITAPVYGLDSHTDAVQFKDAKDLEGVTVYAVRHEKTFIWIAAIAIILIGIYLINTKKA